MPFQPLWFSDQSVNDVLTEYKDDFINYSAAHVGNLRASHIAFMRHAPQVNTALVSTNNGDTDREFSPHLVRNQVRPYEIIPADMLAQYPHHD